MTAGFDGGGLCSDDDEGLGRSTPLETVSVDVRVSKGSIRLGGKYGLIPSANAVNDATAGLGIGSRKP